jgi:hypothetical protein
MLLTSVVACSNALSPTTWCRLTRPDAGKVRRASRNASAATTRPLPGTVVVTASDVDAHNHVVRYAWKIVDQEGHTVMEGTDIAERSNDGRRRRLAAVLVVGGDGV